MSRKPTGRRNTQTINLRLDRELDADLIAWLEAVPPGKRSDAVRTALREELQAAQLLDELSSTIRATVREALSGIQITAAQQGVDLDTNPVEAEFGAKLDKLLNSF